METITAWYNKGVKDLGLGNFLIHEESLQLYMVAYQYGDFAICLPDARQVNTRTTQCFRSFRVQKFLLVRFMS